MDYTLRGVDDELWRKFKARAALKGMTIKDLLIELLEREVGEYVKKEEERLKNK